MNPHNSMKWPHFTDKKPEAQRLKHLTPRSPSEEARLGEGGWRGAKDGIFERRIRVVGQKEPLARLRHVGVIGG